MLWTSFLKITKGVATSSCCSSSCTRRSSGSLRTTLLLNHFTPTTITTTVIKTATITPTTTIIRTTTIITMVTTCPTVSITTAPSIIVASPATVRIAVCMRVTRRTIAETTSTMDIKMNTCIRRTITETGKITGIIHQIGITMTRVDTLFNQSRVPPRVPARPVVPPSRLIRGTGTR